MYSGATLPAWDEPYDPSGRFFGWKVDLITPFRRNRLGFDVSDAVIDLVVRSDRSYLWKDLDEIAQLVELGIFSQSEADGLIEDASEVVSLIEHGLPPFDDEWVQWRPPPNLVFVPETPEGWQYLPVADSEWGTLHRRMNPQSYT